MKLIAVTFLTVASSSLAQHALAEEAHEHGVGWLNVVLEGSELHMELISPGANIVGFEYRPSSAEDKSAVEEAVHQLEDGDSLFDLPAAAGCQLADAKVSTEMLEDEHASHEGERNHEDHEAESSHEEDAHEDHDESTHSEFHATYRFTCDDAEALDRISVKMFEHFPATEELEAQVIGPQGQTARELSADDPIIDL